VGITIDDFNQAKHLAVERGIWKIRFEDGGTITGRYLSESNLRKGK
jgi:hypothetical protein